MERIRDEVEGINLTSTEFEAPLRITIEKDRTISVVSKTLVKEKVEIVSYHTTNVDSDNSEGKVGVPAVRGDVFEARKFKPPVIIVVNEDGPISVVQPIRDDNTEKEAYQGYYFEGEATNKRNDFTIKQGNIRKRKRKKKHFSGLILKNHPNLDAILLGIIIFLIEILLFTDIHSVNLSNLSKIFAW